jgi:transcriptional regulator CtsR
VTAASTESYRGLVQRLRELDGSVFTEREAQLVRDAADARLFGDADQMDSVRAALDLLEALVEAARLSSRTCAQLADLLCAIEPAAGVES